MPLRRWIILLMLLVISCVVSVVPVIYILLVDRQLYDRMFIALRPSPRMLFIQLAEPLLDYGLIRLRGWAYGLGLFYFGVRGIYAAGLGVGMALAGQPEALSVGLPVALLWLGIALFLFVNRIYFDE